MEWVSPVECASGSPTHPCCDESRSTPGSTTRTRRRKKRRTLRRGYDYRAGCQMYQDLTAACGEVRGVIENARRSSSRALFGNCVQTRSASLFSICGSRSPRQAVLPLEEANDGEAALHQRWANQNADGARQPEPDQCPREHYQRVSLPHPLRNLGASNSVDQRRHDFPKYEHHEGSDEISPHRRRGDGRQPNERVADERNERRECSNAAPKRRRGCSR